MQPCGKDRGNGATGTGQSAVGGEAALASVGFFCCQRLEQIRRGTGVNFVWGVTVKSVMRHLAVVGLNEKVDEGPKSFHGIERVQVEPVVFDRAPKGGAGNTDLGNSAQIPLANLLTQPVVIPAAVSSACDERGFNGLNHGFTTASLS
jgi:hypothetical protein